MVQHELSASTRVGADSPVRTCVGCRQRTLAADLLRIVARDGGPKGYLLVPDLQRRLPGRGAWLHRDPHCLSEAERRRAFGRALRVSGRVDPSALDHVVGSMDRSAGKDDPAVPETFEKNRYKHS